MISAWATIVLTNNRTWPIDIDDEMVLMVCRDWMVKFGLKGEMGWRSVVEIQG